MGLVDGKLHQLALLLTYETHGLKFNTHPNSLYMHLLAFYFKDINKKVQGSNPTLLLTLKKWAIENKQKNDLL